MAHANALSAYRWWDKQGAAAMAPEAAADVVVTVCDTCSQLCCGKGPDLGCGDG